MKKAMITLLVTAMLISTGCHNETHTKIAAQSLGVPPAATNRITFKVDGKVVETTAWTISRSILDNHRVLNVTSNMHEDERTINFNINGFEKGTYPFIASGGYGRDGVAYGSYFPDYQEEMGNSWKMKEGEFTIHSIDTVAGWIDASFHGVVEGPEGARKVITKGSITRGQLKPGVMRY